MNNGTVNQPFYYANIWRGGDNKIVGEIITYQRYQECLNSRYRLWSFTGHRATVCIVTNGAGITRANALDFAIMFMKGTYVTITVDLDKCTSTTIAGSPPPCY